ncbi:MAG: tetratricopeptide repeat protein [Hyphomicrobiales bacterium]|nr:tetratricopeptide repeat protein [Hyphomicrobiales bacterium]
MTLRTWIWVHIIILVFVNTSPITANSQETTSSNIIKCLAIAATIDSKNSRIACDAALETSINPALKEKILLSRAYILIILGEQTAAMEDLISARSQNPNSPLILSKIASLKQFSDPRMAAELFVEALSHSKGNEAVILKSNFHRFLLQSSKRASKSGDYTQAVSHLNILLAQTSSSSVRHQLLSFRGRMKLRMENEEEALEDWKKAIAGAPELPWAYLARGLYLYSKKQVSEALEDFEASYERRKNAPTFIIPQEPYVQILQQSGQKFLAEQDLFAASKVYQRIVNIASPDELKPLNDYFLSVVLQHLYARDFKLAKQNSKLAISFFRDIKSQYHVIDYQLRLASIYKDSGEDNEATLLVQQAHEDLRNVAVKDDISAKVQDRFADLYVKVAIVFLKSGDTVNAKMASRSALLYSKSDSTALKVSESLGDVWYFIGPKIAGADAYNIALELYERATRESTNNRLANRIHLKLAKVKVALGQHDDALKIIDDILLATPDHAQARINKAKLKLDKDDVAAAIREFNVALKFSRTPGERLQIHISLATIFKNSGDAQQALAQYKAAQKEAPNDASILHEIGLLYVGINRTGDALGAFDQAILLDEAFFKSSFERGKIYLSEEKHKEALKDFDRFILKEKNAEKTMLFQVKFFKAISLFNLGKIDESKYIFEELSFVDKDEPRLFLWRARIATRKGRVEEALRFFDKSLSVLPQKDVAAYQSILGNKGFSVGVIDGVYGPSTKRALKRCIIAKCF